MFTVCKLITVAVYLVFNSSYTRHNIIIVSATLCNKTLLKQSKTGHATRCAIQLELDYGLGVIPLSGLYKNNTV